MSDPTETAPRLCAWCGDPVPEQKGAGRRRDYCRRSCRQRAFEERKVVKRIEERERLARIAVLTEVASKSPRDEIPVASNSARDEMQRERPPGASPASWVPPPLGHDGLAHAALDRPGRAGR